MKESIMKEKTFKCLFGVMVGVGAKWRQLRGNEILSKAFLFPFLFIWSNLYE